MSYLDKIRNILTVMDRRIIICDALAISDYLSRKELGRILEIPRTTLYENLKWLKDMKIVKSFTKEREPGQRGRSIVYWKLRGD